MEKTKSMRFKIKKSALKIGFIFAIAGGMLTSCSNYEEHTPEPDETEGGTALEDIDYEKRNTIFGKGGLTLFDSKPEDNSGGALGVNFYLWRASIDTISFMPVNTADAFGGVILTDWHTPPEAPSERFKLNVYILDRKLRADGVRVAVFRQIQDRTGNWKDAAVPDETGIKIEDAILMRARQLRNQSITN